MSLVDQAIKIQNQLQQCQNDIDFWWDRFNADGGETPFYSLTDAETLKASLQLELETLTIQYEKKNISSNNNNLTYALTIGSPEKEDHEPCYGLYKRFVQSSLCNDAEFVGYFEKGDNGYIHIHATITKNKKFPLSVNEIRKRYGKHKNKQFNFDIKRIIGLEIPKWNNYIKKDNGNNWNTSVNTLLKSLKNQNREELTTPE